MVLTLTINHHSSIVNIATTSLTCTTAYCAASTASVRAFQSAARRETDPRIVRLMQRRLDLVHTKLPSPFPSPCGACRRRVGGVKIAETAAQLGIALVSSLDCNCARQA